MICTSFTKQVTCNIPHSAWSQLLALLAAAPRLRSLHANVNCYLYDGTVAAFGGVVPTHLRSLRICGLGDPVPPEQLGACLGRLTALTELDLTWDKGCYYDSEAEDDDDDVRFREQPFPSGLFACTALRRLALASGGQVRFLGSAFEVGRMPVMKFLSAESGT